MKSNLEESVMVEKMDYYNLGRVDRNTFDGVLTMESLCYAVQPERVFAEFFRVLKPAGKLVLHELAWSDTMPSPGGFDAQAEMLTSLNRVVIFEGNTLRKMVKKQGFKNVVVEDISAQIIPHAPRRRRNVGDQEDWNPRNHLRLFFAMAYIPSFFIRHCGLQKFFVNQTSAIILYKGMKIGFLKYIVVTGRKSSPNDIIVQRSKPISFSRRRNATHKIGHGHLMRTLVTL